MKFHFTDWFIGVLTLACYKANNQGPLVTAHLSMTHGTKGEWMASRIPHSLADADFDGRGVGASGQHDGLRSQHSSCSV